MSTRIFSSLQRKPRRSATATNKRDGSEELMVIAQKNGWTPRSSLTMAEIQNMGSLEFRYHELFSPDAVAGALKADPKLKTTEQSDKKDGREIRPLTYAEVTEKFSAEDAAWHLRFNKQNYEAAFDEEERRRQSKKHVAQTKVELQWQGHATDEEIKKAYETGAEFSSRFPQFLETPANMQTMLNWMKDNDLPATELSSYVSAFRTLSQDGRLEMRKAETADEFLKNHPELRGDLNGKPVTPPLIKAREAKAQATADFAAKTQAASAHAGSTTVIAYEDAQTGFPAAATKYSFRKLLDSLSADEFQKRLNEDHTFRAAVEKLDK